MARYSQRWWTKSCSVNGWGSLVEGGSREEQKITVCCLVKGDIGKEGRMERCGGSVDGTECGRWKVVVVVEWMGGPRSLMTVVHASNYQP